MSPQTAPLTFFPSHLKSIVARPLPETTRTGSSRLTLLPPNFISGLPVLSFPVTLWIWTCRSYCPIETTFLTVPVFFTFRFLSSSVTWSTKPLTTLVISSSASEVGTPTRTGVVGMPWMIGSAAMSVSSFARRLSRSASSVAICC